MTNDEINALKRLERHGDPQSKTNEKIREATEILVSYVCRLAPQGCAALANHGYKVVDGKLYMVGEEEGADDERIWNDCALDTLLFFSEDVASGLIEKIEAELRTPKVG